MSDKPRFWSSDPEWRDYEAPQFLESTWAMYGGKPADVREQVRIGLDYMRKRYGTDDAKDVD